MQLTTLAQADSTRRMDSGRLIPADTLQQRDTLLQQDTLRRADTVKPVVAKPLYIRFDSTLYHNHPYYKFDNPVHFIAEKREWAGKEIFFYLSVGLLLFFAFIRNAFGRYLKDLFRLFFRTTVKQRQVKEQMMQSPLPSLLLNLLFIFSGAIFINLIFRQYGLGASYSFWILFLYVALALALIYLVKFITLKLCGWIFRLQEATDSYTFIVFTTNKVLGIVWLPFIILLAFTNGMTNEWFVTLSLIVTGSLFAYRFYLSYASLPKGVRLHPFHFLLYLCAFEIVPLLLINKLLFMFLS